MQRHVCVCVHIWVRVCVIDLHVCFCENCVYSHRCASPLRETMIHSSPPALLFLGYTLILSFIHAQQVCMCVCDVHGCVFVYSEGYGGCTAYI